MLQKTLDVLCNKKKLEKKVVVDLSEGVMTCAVLQKSLSPKLNHLGSFSTPFVVEVFVVDK